MNSHQSFEEKYSEPLLQNDFVGNINSIDEKIENQNHISINISEQKNPQLSLSYEITLVYQRRFSNDQLANWQKKKLNNCNMIGTLSSQIALGFTRDIIWAWRTIDGSNYFKDSMPEFFGQTLTQMIDTSLPMLVMLGLCTTVSERIFLIRSKEILKKHARIGFTSWSAIPVWNAAQLLGIYASDQLNLNRMPGIFVTGLFTGSFESLYQNGIAAKLFSVAIDYPVMLLNILSGAVWEWILDGLKDDMDPELQSTVLAACVAASTLYMTFFPMLVRAYNRVLQKELAEEKISHNDALTRIQHSIQTQDNMDLLLDAKNKLNVSPLQNLSITRSNSFSEGCTLKIENSSVARIQPSGRHTP